MSSGTVMFFPVGGGPVAYGRITADGVYTLHIGQGANTDSSKSGVAPGEYRVTVVATTPGVQTTPGGPPPLGELITPARYAQVETTDLKHAVKAGDNVIDIELVSAAPADQEMPGEPADQADPAQPGADPNPDATAAPPPAAADPPQAPEGNPPAEEPKA